MAQINKSDEYFNTKLYTGNGTTDTAITGVGFQPDMTWIKSRSAATPHSLTDAVRGNNQGLYPNLTNAENTSSNYVKSFDNDGFTLGTDSIINANSATFASWNWLASNTTASNTVGDINSTVSANTTSGFSIVSYTGTGSSSATIGHGLGVTPKMIIIKNRSTTSNWVVYHETMGNNQIMFLDLTDGQSLSNGTFNATSPTNSTFTVGNSLSTNGSGNNIIAYCFSEIKGFSKFGSYVGNGSVDGSFCYLGFKPKLVIVKEYGASGNWIMKESRFDNQNDSYILSNDPSSEVNANAVVGFDLLSNGFKLRGTAGDSNGAGANILYMAFAEEPLVGDNPCTAR